jgi:uncharacterized protein
VLIPQTKTESLDIRLGRDAKFPINGNFQSIAGLNVLLQDIQTLLLTIPGERVNRPTWGCGLRALIWENLDEAATSGTGAIQAALAQHEPRINVSSVDYQINRNTGLISFTIRFAVKSTDTIVNLVFPFRTSQQIASA